MRALRRYSHFGVGLSLAIGVTLAILLFVECVRTYYYVDTVLVPQEAEREAERQAGALMSSVRAAGVTDPHALGPVMERAIEAGSRSAIWMRLLDQDSAVLAEAGAPVGQAKVPPKWWERVEKHQSLGRVLDTPGGKAYGELLPFRMPRPSRPGPPEAQSGSPDVRERPPQGIRRSPAYVLDLAIRLDAVTGAFSGLRQNLVFGVFASLALLASMAVIGLRAPNYLRGKYLERELQLARRVQNDLQPKAVSVSPYIDFAATAAAADHVGGDFYDIFETDSGRIAIVLGDVSGKGVSAALLVSVVQGAIRSSSAVQHETTCERMNRMLCERTAAERFVTLFWGVFDPLTATLRYVNAGHAAPLLLRAEGGSERLGEGGPVLGLLPAAKYSAGAVQVETGDLLIVYSDGINEAANEKQQEFGEERVAEIVSASSRRLPREICDEIMTQVSYFARAGTSPDDRTLMVVRFLRSRAAMTA